MLIIDVIDGGNVAGQDAQVMEISDTLRRMDLNLVVPLNALLEHRHVTRAAKSAGIGQSAMSAALSRLRRLFGDPLLVRNGRVLELTPMGQSLVEPVRAVLTGLEQLLATSPHFDPATDERMFTVVASDYVTLILLRPLLERLNREAPGVAVTAIPVSGTTEAELERAQVDLVIMPREITSPAMADFPQRELFTDRYVAAVWTEHPEVTDHLDRDQLTRLRYVRYHATSGGPGFVDFQLAKLGIEPKVALSTLSFTLVPWLLPGTSLFAFVHERLVNSTAGAPRAEGAGAARAAAADRGDHVLAPGLPQRPGAPLAARMRLHARRQPFNAAAHLRAARPAVPAALAGPGTGYRPG